MKIKKHLVLLFASLSILPCSADNKMCPIMIDDEIDEEEFVEYEGKKVYLCCGKCLKIWNKAPKYFIKASPELLPQFKGMEEKLALGDVKLLPQKFCPVYNDRIITPDSPSIEIEGKKVHLWSKSAIRRWNKDPEGSLKEALEAGLLPQFSENKKVAGKTNLPESSTPKKTP